MYERFRKSSPPWPVLSLVANYLDPKTLTIASCVCKSWSVSMSSDHLWQPICAALYPSLSNLRSAANPAVPYRQLFSIGYAAQKRRLQKPARPRLSLDEIAFAFDVHSSSGRLSTTVKAGRELDVDGDSLFRFDIDFDPGIDQVEVEELGELRVTWNVVLNGFKSVFTMMDCKGKGSFVLGLEGWFSKELPPSGCCSGGGLVADLRLGLREGGGGKVATVEKMCVGVLSVVSWRYVCIDDALRYLQHFLLWRI